MASTRLSTGERCWNSIRSMMTKAEPSEGDNPMRQYASDIAFTTAVKEIQSRKGSRSSYSNVEKGRGWQTKVTPDLTVFLSELDMLENKESHS